LELAPINTRYLSAIVLAVSAALTASVARSDEPVLPAYAAATRAPNPIQELTRRLKQKDVQIAEMKARITVLTAMVARNDVEIAAIKGMNDQVLARMAKLEHQSSGGLDTYADRR
jgi:DNA repair ATPase RecN